VCVRMFVCVYENVVCVRIHHVYRHACIPIHLLACISTCMYIDMYVYRHVGISTCIDVDTYVYGHACISTCMYTDMQVYGHACTSTCMYVNMYVYGHVCI